MEFAKEVNSNSITQIENEGVEIIKLDESMIEQMKNAAESAYALVRQDLGDEIVDALLNGLK